MNRELLRLSRFLWQSFVQCLYGSGTLADGANNSIPIRGPVFVEFVFSALMLQSPFLVSPRIGPATFNSVLSKFQDLYFFFFGVFFNGTNGRRCGFPQVKFLTAGACKETRVPRKVVPKTILTLSQNIKNNYISGRGE